MKVTSLLPGRRSTSPRRTDELGRILTGPDTPHRRELETLLEESRQQG